MKKIVVVGQTPPPFGGQAVMIEHLVKGVYKEMKVYHVRMHFSQDLSDRGKCSFYKIIQLFKVIFEIWRIRICYGVKIIYYPPSSSPRVAVLRDAIILGCTRWIFKDVIFHFHAAGISEELPKYNVVLRKIVYQILKKPRLSITSSQFNPDDATYLDAYEKIIIPLGIPDANPHELRKNKNKEGLTLLFMGLLNETKGEGYVLEAVRILKERGFDIEFNIAGRFENDEYCESFMRKIRQYELENVVHYCGVVTGKKKQDLFLSSDIMCFPSYFSSESFGIVLLEAMMYQMPIIASRWRGVQSVVDEGCNGYLVDVKNVEQIVVAVEKFYNNRSLIACMGKEGRRVYCERYELSKYLMALENAVNNL